MTDRKNKSTDLKKAIRELAIRMVDIKHLCDVVKQGFGDDLNYEDYAVSTSFYDGGIFKVAKMKKLTSRGRDTGEFIENPYTENVVKSDKMNITRKSNGDEDGWDEKRIKMFKLSMIGWCDTTNSYPIISSNPIVFRQQIVDFKFKYRWEMETINRILNSDTTTKAEKDEAESMLPLFQELFKIEPFPAYYDEKYGFLIKRKIQFTRIVLDMPEGAKSIYSREVANNEAVIKTSNKHKEDFKQEVIAEALHPDRVEYLINKHGIEDGMSTYD
jgi:hypothetical protein